MEQSETKRERRTASRDAGVRDLATERRSRRLVGFRGFVTRLMRTRMAPLGVAVILLLILTAIFAPIIAPFGPREQNFAAALSSPNTTHWMGTDQLGRDTFSRVVYGSRVSIQVGVIAVGISFIIGTVLGLIAGYAGVSFVDSVISRFMDALLAFPALVLALAITAALGPSLTNVMIAIGIVGIPIYARLVRGQVLSVRQREYVEAARTIGVPDYLIIARHIFPNVTAPLIVQASIGVAVAIIAEASLSFLGLGVQPPTPSWGGMIAVGKDWLQQAPWMSFAPGVAIFVTVLAFNFVGDALRDALDPHMQNRM
jgi:peptide/nickel transport system permease protein